LNDAYLLLWVWAAAAVAMLAGWLWQLRSENAGIVDVIWSGGLGAGAVFLAITSGGAEDVRVLTGLLGGLWGLRLGLHLWGRVRAGEDGRYHYLRAHWKGSQLGFFALFQFQALLVALFALPFWVAANNPGVHPKWLAAALLTWLLSVGGEWLADRQLEHFRADRGNRNRTCRSGLWRFSRHPNYFFEWLHWFTYVALATGATNGWLALSGPALMFIFLRFLSGIPFTEAQALRSRGEDYRDYQRCTPMLFPWFPKESA
jgi:steroid 5-alpha reductase family enzyme